MKARVFYFSGTGNSLYAAKKICSVLNDCPVISISAMNEDDVIVDEDVIGIIFPVYCMTIPSNVKRFVRKLKFESAPSGRRRRPYIFSIATNNGAPGRANDDLNRILKRKGQRLNSGFTVTMPGNSIIIADYTNTEEEIKKRLAKTEKFLAEISKSVKNKITGNIESDRSLKWFIKGRMTSVVKRIYNVPKHFWTNSKCSKCGVCMKLCPGKNIKIGISVEWKNKCVNCLACYHWCPNKAIELDGYSKDRKQYHHPEIDVKEMYL